MECRNCKYWRRNPNSQAGWGQCIIHTYPGEELDALTDIVLGGNQDAADAIDERIFETLWNFGCVQYGVNKETVSYISSFPCSLKFNQIITTSQ